MSSRALAEKSEAGKVRYICPQSLLLLVASTVGAAVVVDAQQPSASREAHPPPARKEAREARVLDAQPASMLIGTIKDNEDVVDEQLAVAPLFG